MLGQASVSPSSWYWWHQQPEWTPSWCSACRQAPGYPSGSLRTCKHNFAVSCASGSFWVQYCRQWLACSNDANLALVVLGRLSQLLKTYHHSLNRKKHVLLCKMSPTSYFLFVRRRKIKINKSVHSCCEETLRTFSPAFLKKKQKADSHTTSDFVAFIA